MTKYCSKCGEKLKEDALFCANCGEKVPNKQNRFSNKHILIILIIFVILAIFLSATFLLNQTQTVKVDNVEFEIPADYVSEPLRTDVNYDGNIKSSAMGWSNKDNYIEIGVTRTPGKGIDSQKVAADLGGTPTKMYGYTGYYLEYENEGYAFVFGIKDEVCMVYVSNHDVFDDISVKGAV